MNDAPFYQINPHISDVFMHTAINNGSLVEVELLECFDCGVRSPDKAHFQYVNREKAGFNYPGSDGDLACAACATGHAEWYREH